MGMIQRSARLEQLRARAPRYLAMGALTLTCLVGLRSMFWPSDPASAGSSGVVVDNAAQDFAQRFARAYLAYDAARPGLRERLLRPLLPEDLELDAGLTAARGSQEVLWTQVASNQEAIAGGRIVVVAVGVSTQPEPLYLSAPLDRLEGAIGLTAYPSLVGPPIASRAPLPEREAVEERAVLAVARRAVSNYLAGSEANLAADLARGAVVSAPTRPLRLLSVEGIAWAAGAGSSAVLATVTARDELGASWTLTYEIGVARERGRSVVTFIETVPTDP